jgi:hypothetical protein
MSVTIEVDAADVLLELRRIAERVDDGGLGRFLEWRAWPFLRQRAVERFQTQGDAASGTWAQLRESTVNIRERKGFPGRGPINVRTGKLRDHVLSSHNVTRRGGAALRIPGSTGGKELGDKLRAAQIGDAKSRTVARPVLALDGTDESFIVTALERWIIAGVA